MIYSAEIEHMLPTLRTFLLDGIFQDLIESVTRQLSCHHIHDGELSGLDYNSRIDRLHK